VTQKFYASSGQTVRAFFPNSHAAAGLFFKNMLLVLLSAYILLFGRGARVRHVRTFWGAMQSMCHKALRRFPWLLLTGVHFRSDFVCGFPQL
jgi:hypothetical protein